VNVDDISVGEGRSVAFQGQLMAVFRLKAGSLRALDAVCPHRGGPPADGLLDDRVVVCPLHGFTYDLITGVETANSGAAVQAYWAAEDADGCVLRTAGSPLAQ